MKHYETREIYLMDKVPPDGWQIVTKLNGVATFGEIGSLQEALAEFALLWQAKIGFESIEIAPMWNETWHDDVA